MAATKPYRPSNGTEGMAFMASWCDQCVKANMQEDNPRPPCPILGRAMAGGAEEWQLDEANDPICTAFKADDGEPEEPARCTATLDMFGG